MKRPEGFDRGVPPTPAAKPRTAPQRRTPKQGVPKQAAPEQGVPKRKTPKQAAPKQAAPKPTVPKPVAGRELRRAEAARRRYERSEVRRFTRRTRRRRITGVVAVACLLLLLGFVAAAVYSPLLSLKRIEITGTSRLDKQTVLNAVDGQVGTPLALVDFGKIRAELSTFPLIRSYVTESVPPDTLVIRISERTPIALLQTAAGYSVIDAAGVVLQDSSTRPAGLPLLTGSAALTKNAAFVASVDVLLSLSPDILAKVDSITAQTTDNVTLTLVGGATVLWGSDEQSALKGRVLSTLIADQPGAGRYDVTAPTTPVFVP